MITVYFDGLCEPTNPYGIATYGFEIFRDGIKIHESCGLACEPLTWQASNNVAEYTGLIMALKYLYDNNYIKEEIIMMGDSQLTIYQMVGAYAVNADRLIPLHKRAMNIAKCFAKLEFRWIPREQNSKADDLSRRAYISYIDSHPDVASKVLKYSATDKQRQLLRKMGLEFDKYLTKIEASRLINRNLKYGVAKE